MTEPEWTPVIPQIWADMPAPVSSTASVPLDGQRRCACNKRERCSAPCLYTGADAADEVRP